MANPLRQRRSAADWAAASQVIEIAEEVGDFEQLSAIVGEDLAALDAARIPADWRHARVTGRLAFGFADAQRTMPCAACELQVTVDAVCQRCLEPFRLPLEVQARLLLLEFEQAADGYDEYEVWELEDRLLEPSDIVEELLVMAVPFAATHTDPARCRVLVSAAPETNDEMTTPFAALREQMAKDK